MRRLSAIVTNLTLFAQDLKALFIYILFRNYEIVLLETSFKSAEIYFQVNKFAQSKSQKNFFLSKLDLVE